jgi:hypothetical protein
MKKISTLIVLAGAVTLTGCHNLGGVNHAQSRSALSAEPLQVYSRAQEFGFSVVGDATGTAETRKFLFLTIGGDRTDASLPLYGATEGTQLESLAALRAARSLNADGFYQVSTEREKANLLWIYRREKVTVTGKALRTRDLGTVSAERADKIRLESIKSRRGWFGLRMRND